MEYLAHLAHMSVAYVIASILVGLGLRLMTTYPRLKPATWIVVACPLACILLAETSAMRWLDLMENSGISSLAPVMSAAALAVAAAAIGHVVVPATRQTGETERSAAIDWAGITLIACIIAIALWHYWPAQNPIFQP